VGKSLSSNKRAHFGGDDHCVPDDLEAADGEGLVDSEPNYFLDELLLAQVRDFAILMFQSSNGADDLLYLAHYELRVTSQVSEILFSYFLTVGGSYGPRALPV
jgi:hypothetical protein